MKIICKTICSIFLFVLYFSSTEGVAQEQDEHATLQKLHQTLTENVRALKSEQDFLLFQKMMSAVDSKYLVLDLSKKSGQLKYKNKVLKDFHFIPAKNLRKNALQAGMLVLTEKIEGKEGSFALFFGTSLVVQGKNNEVPRRMADIPAFSLLEKEMLAVFYAVEKGTLAYIVR